MSGLAWRKRGGAHNDFYANPRGICSISVFPSAASPGKWTWAGTGAHGHDLGLFDTADAAKADAERWWTAHTTKEPQP